MTTFKPTGRFSKAWFIKTIKENQDRRGFSWIRKEYRGAPQFSDLKEMITTLVNERYIDRYGKPDAKGSTYFRITTLGHRYLEGHKDSLRGAEPLDDTQEKIQAATERISKANERVAEEGLQKMNDGLIGKNFSVGESVDPKYTHEDIVEPAKKKKEPPLGIIPVPEEEGAKKGGFRAPGLRESPLTPTGMNQLQNAAGAGVEMPGDYFDRIANDRIRKLVGAALLAKFGDQMTVKEFLEYIDGPKETPTEDPEAW